MRAEPGMCFVYQELPFRLEVLVREPTGTRISRIFPLRPDYLKIESDFPLEKRT